MSGNKQVSNGASRRNFFLSAGAATAALASWQGTARATPAMAPSPEVYTRIGARPFINCTATLTINGGSRLLPEVIEAVEQASHYHVNLDDLMEAAGRRISSLLKVEWAIVTSGAAAALTHSAAACVAGTDPELIQQLPGLRGLKDQVIIPKSSRNQYDQAVRAIGLETVEVETMEELKAAIGSRTALVMILGNRFEDVPLSLEEVAPVAKAAGVPVLVDAAADYLIVPNPYIAAGADLVAYSGGKIIRGPQTAGLLIGREDLVRAAFANSAPHHSFGRPMKVSKEEIVGMTRAVEVFVEKRNLDEEYAEWKGWYQHISDAIGAVKGVTTEVRPPSRGGPFPTLQIAWDPKRIGLTAGELGKMLLEGEPAIQTHASGDGHAFALRPVAMKPDEYQVVARRLREVFEKAPAPKKVALKAPAADLTGRWDVHVRYLKGEARHLLFLEARGNQVEGTHVGSVVKGPLKGTVDGAKVSFKSTLPIEGSRLGYAFEGELRGGKLEGKLDLGEYPEARWTAVRHEYGKPVPEDPSKAGKTS